MSQENKILVVDDKAVNVSLLIGILKTKYEVLVAKNGARGIDLAMSENQPDLILLDINMPEMDGFEVCRRLKEDEATKDIPVIFMTAVGDEDSEKKGFDMGCVDFLHKPFSPYIVKARVETHLKLKNGINGKSHGNASGSPAGQETNDAFQAFKKDLVTFIDGWKSS